MLILLILLPLSVTASVVSEAPNLFLLDCFEYKKNYWLVGHAFHTSSVQFKDQCLRLCLSSVIRGSPCLSAMHIPGDDQCVISDQNQLTRPDLFIENDVEHSFTVNYFRNKCVDPPASEAGGILEARLRGFQGGRGLATFSQRRGRNPHMMLILNGLKENQHFSVHYSPSASPTSCLGTYKKNKSDQDLVSAQSDSRGMAVLPWREVDFHILDDSLLDKVIMVVDNFTSTVVVCGKLQIRGNVTDWEAAKNDVAGNPSLLATPLLLTIVTLLVSYVYA